MGECEEFRKMAIDADSAEGAQLQGHAPRCPQCRDQLLIDSDLRQLFQGIARPAPSPHFTRVLRQRLRAEGERQRRRRWRLVLMQAYWVAASVVSAIIMMLIRWPSELPSVPVMCSFGAVFGMVLLTTVMLFLSLRIGPMNLILNTMDEFSQ